MAGSKGRLTAAAPSIPARRLRELFDDRGALVATLLLARGLRQCLRNAWY
jgi:hypothetical protein